MFSGPPSADSCILVEVETPNGTGLSLGTWLKRPDGYWVIRVTPDDAREVFELDAIQRVVIDREEQDD